MEGRDRAFARAIVSAALRRLGGIDLCLNAFLQRPIDQASPEARTILRCAGAQMLVLNTPPHAVVGESVALAKRMAPGQDKLINAVLRRLSERGDAMFAAQKPGDDLPAWLFARWRAAYGDDASAIARALQEEPPIDISVKADAHIWADRLDARAMSANTLRLNAAAPITTLSGYDEGAWWVQDYAAASVVELAGDVAGLSALDLCAAPGGKTMQLASAGAQVTALDISAERMRRVEENLSRTRLHARAIVADARTWQTNETFDLVLIDAPCTATGTLRRHPDVAWLRRASDISTLVEIQTALLNRAIALAKPGGRVLYAVCSLEPEEGEGVIAHALQQWPDRIADTGKTLRTTPATRADEGGMDGFYAHLLTRRA